MQLPVRNLTLIRANSNEQRFDQIVEAQFLKQCEYSLLYNCFEWCACVSNVVPLLALKRSEQYYPTALPRLLSIVSDSCLPYVILLTLPSSSRPPKLPRPLRCSSPLLGLCQFHSACAFPRFSLFSRYPLIFSSRREEFVSLWVCGFFQVLIRKRHESNFQNV